MNNKLLLFNVWLLIYGFILNGGMSDNNNVALMSGIAALFILLTKIERKL